MNIDTVIDALARGGVRLTAAELADALLVAAHAVSTPQARTDGTRPPAGSQDSEASHDDPPPDDSPATPPRPVFDDQASSSPGSAGGMPVHLPAGRALPRPLETARSLRPFTARWRRGSTLAFDIDKTVEASAATGLIVPALSPTTEKWFDVNLVFDATPSMSVWDSTVDELAELLTQLGTFRLVRRWRLETDADRIMLVNDKQLRRVPAEALLSQGSRQLTVVVSDWMDEAWQSDLLWSALRRWSRAMPTALLNPLPTRLWQRTNMTAYPSVLGPGPPGTPNTGLSAETPHLPGRPTSAAQWVALPTIALNTHALDRWARMLMRGQPTGCAGIVVAREGAMSFPDPIGVPSDIDGSAAVERFRIRCSPAAFRLATLCAIQPIVSLPVIQLIRQAMVPEADTGDIAEVVVNRLVVQRRSSSAGRLQFRFHEAARQQLLTHVSTDDAWQLFNGISRHLAQEAGRGLTATVAHPAGLLPLPADLAPFAEATDATLRLLGVETQQERRRIILQTVEEGRASGAETGAADSALRVTVLGRTGITRDGAHQPLAHAPTVLMLRLLLARGETVSIRQLYQDVWHLEGAPALPQSRAIERRIREIARAIGPSQLVLVTNQRGIHGYRMLIGRDQVDMYEFEDLVREATAAAPADAVELLHKALAMWGQPLPEVGHEAFAGQRVRELEDAAQTARRLLVTSYRDAGRPAEALQLAENYLTDLMPDDPVLGELCRQLRRQVAAAEVSGQHTYAVYLRDTDPAQRHLDVLVVTAGSGNLHSCLTHQRLRRPEGAGAHRVLAYAGRPAGILYTSVMVSADPGGGTRLSDPLVRQALTAAAGPLLTGRPDRDPQLLLDAARALTAIAADALAGPGAAAVPHEAFLFEQDGQFAQGSFAFVSAGPAAPVNATCEVRLVEQKAAPARRLLLAVDIVGYAQLSMRDATAVQQRLATIVEEVLSTVAVPGEEVVLQHSGDGFVCLLPVAVDPADAVPLALRRMSERLAVSNAAEPLPLRLRLAMHYGIVSRTPLGYSGDAVVTVHRLLDSEPLRRASSEHGLAALLSEQLHQDIAGRITAETVPVEVGEKGFAARAWLWLPAAMG